ncbi:27363_t:CDS:2, partial [Racocetra persica]
LVGRNNGLQTRYNELNQRFERMEEEKEELNQKIEELRGRIERETRHLEEVRNARNEERLRGEASGLRIQLNDSRLLLTESQNEVARLENNVNEKKAEIENLTDQLNTLQLVSNSIDIQLQVANRDLERVQQERDERITATDLQALLFEMENRDREVTSLGEQLGQSRESGLTEKLRNKGQKLENFTHRLGMELGQIQLLQDIYNELVRSRKNGNMNGIRENQNLIGEIKQNFLQDRIHLDDVQGICDKCEEIAELNLQLEQQFEARQEKLKYETGFTTGSGGYDYAEELRRRREAMEEELADINDKLKKIREIEKHLARCATIDAIKIEMSLKGVWHKHIDSKIGDDENSDGIDTSELDKFKKLILNFIRDKKIQLDEEKMRKANSDLERTKIKEIGAIERELENKNLKVEDLNEEYQDYEEKINNLTKIFKIRSLADKIIRHIHSKNEKKFESKKSFDYKKPDMPEESPLEPIEKDDEDLIKRIEELEAEVRQLREEKGSVKEDELPEFYRPKKSSSADEFVVGAAMMVVAGLVIAVLIIRKKK